MIQNNFYVKTGLLVTLVTEKKRSLWPVDLGSHPESSPYLVFWSSSLNSLDLCSQLYEPLACSPKSSMQDAVFSIISLKVLLISMLLLCSVDGPILPARSRVKLPPSILLPAKAPSSQEVHLNLICTRLDKLRNGRGLTGRNLVPLQGLGIQSL